MPTSVTKSDLQDAFALLKSEVELSGMTRHTGNGELDHSHLVLIEGSKLYGNTFRVMLRDPDTGALYSPPFGVPEFLGWTKPEAYTTLVVAHNAFAGIRQHRARS